LTFVLEAAGPYTVADEFFLHVSYSKHGLKLMKRC